MTKKEFLEVLKNAAKDGMGISVYCEVPGNKELEEIVNHNIDIENKAEYYDGAYDDNMKHKYGPVSITGVAMWDPAECQEDAVAKPELPYLDRMVRERIELADRYHKLVRFTTTEKFTELSKEKKSLMLDQEKGMQDYLKALDNRLKLEGITTDMLQEMYG